MSTESNGHSSVISYLCIKNAAGRVSHAEIEIGGSMLMLADEHPEIGFVSPQTLGGAHVQFFVTVPDVDARVARATAAGGKLTKPIENRFYGHRAGEITDPFGYRWTLSTKIEDVSDEELQRRAQEEEKKRRAK